MRITYHYQSIIAVILLLVLSLPAAAQEEALNEESLLISEAEKGEEPEPVNVPLISTWDFVRMLFILGAVIGVIYLIFFFLKRGLRKQIPENDLIHLIGSRSLSGNRALHLIEVGKSIFLVGSADGGVSLISEIQDREAVDILRLESSATARKAPQAFSNLLQALLKPVKKHGSNINETVNNMKLQRERLKRL